MGDAGAMFCGYMLATVAVLGTYYSATSPNPNRIAVVAEDTWGAEIASSTLAHFAASTPPEYLQNTTDLMNYVTGSTGVGGCIAKNGKLYATDTPGLGVTPDFDSLGDPVASWR